MEPYETPLVYQGITFATNEHFFQAMKCHKSDIDTRRMIASLPNGRQAKKEGRQIKLRDDWEDVKLNVIRFGLRYKFATGTQWRNRLDSTTGMIVETNNWHDNFWGDCICDKCKNIQGENWLGRLLVEIRDESGNKMPRYTGVLDWGVVHYWDVEGLEPGIFRHGNEVFFEGRSFIVKNTGITKHPYLRGVCSLDVYIEPQGDSDDERSIE